MDQGVGKRVGARHFVGQGHFLKAPKFLASMKPDLGDSFGPIKNRAINWVFASSPKNLRPITAGDSELNALTFWDGNIPRISDVEKLMREVLMIG